MPSDITTIVQSVGDFATERLPEFLLRLLAIALLVLIGRWLDGWLNGLVSRTLERHNLDHTIVSFLSKSVYIAVLVAVLIAALTLLGIPTTSIVAVLGASTLAIGLALQDSLSNLASGLLLIFLKPFKNGDFVNLGSGPVEGTIRSIQFFHTELSTADNRTLLVPNREVMDNPIVNYTNLAYRRIDLTFGIDYSDDIRKAKDILANVVSTDPRILTDPAPRIAVGELGDSSVNLVCQPYVRPTDYLAVKSDLLEAIKLRFDEQEITIPSQRVLRVVQDTAEGKSVELGKIAGKMA